ncbi:hypothetical protein DES36_10932 [Alkalibaculum bacchi]|uniref:Uncharacterized protein n=1 Tax=Alkalibaculum bacchi TaxID=645887 RepID=A0A366I842_9FIRM|nr:hypothetical protein [Alkalibaculum bacchi]RBP63815.1 hypothetical protein DES36_10932 [Alkalibaculum bacchi]
MKNINRILMRIHLFVGIGAFFGGVFGMTSPSGAAFGMPASKYLIGSPFKDFFVPSLFLFVIIGIGNIVGFLFHLRKIKYDNLLSMGLGLILCMWIVIQCIILSNINPLHVIFFVIGAIQILLPISKNRKTKDA